MEELQSNNSVEIVIKTISSDGIFMKNIKEHTNKTTGAKAAEYFLNLKSQNEIVENIDDQFVAVAEDCEDNENQQYVTVEVQDSDGIILNEKEVIIWDELCRICANSNEQFIPIFSGEGLEHDLYNKINSYLPVKVSENDSLPHQICYNCAATLLSWHDMFKGCIEAHQRLTELQNKFNSKDEFSNDSTEEIIDTVFEVETVANEESEAQSCREVKQERLPDTPSELERSKDLLQTVNNRDEVLSKKDSTKVNFSVSKHAKTTQVSPSASKKRSSREVKKKDHTKQAKIKSELENHCQNHQRYKTPRNSSVEIKLENVSSKAMKNDVDNSDNDDDNDDDEDYFQEESLFTLKSKQKKSRKKTAGAEESSNTNYECRECNKKFRQQSSYQIHMRLHTGEKPYTCHICGKQFGQTGSLYYHLKHVHGGVKNHACDICGRCFAMKTAMVDHRRIHTGERPFVCDSCGKTFKTKAALFIHSKIHTGEYPFSCSYCKKPFRWKQQMICHLTTHTGEKNHICDICGKGFGVKNELTRHRRTHSQEKPFTCQKCGVSFGQKRYLTNHNRTRHKTKPSSDN